MRSRVASALLLHIPFNSLFEMLCALVPLYSVPLRRPFNSLFEMRDILGCIRLHKGKTALSILYLRCAFHGGDASRFCDIHFQFSI